MGLGNRNSCAPPGNRLNVLIFRICHATDCVFHCMLAPRKRMTRIVVHIGLYTQPYHRHFFIVAFTLGLRVYNIFFFLDLPFSEFSFSHLILLFVFIIFRDGKNMYVYVERERDRKNHYTQVIYSFREILKGSTTSFQDLLGIHP